MKDTKRPEHTTEGAALTALMLDVFRANGALLAAGDRLAGEVGLTSARWQALGAVALSERALPVAHLAQTMGLSRQALQRVINDLEAQGLVAFAPNPHHKRSPLVALTEAGRAAYEAVSAREAPWSNDLAEGFSASDIAAAGRLLKALVRRLEKDPKSA